MYSGYGVDFNLRNQDADIKKQKDRLHQLYGEDWQNKAPEAALENLKKQIEQKGREDRYEWEDKFIASYPETVAKRKRPAPQEPHLENILNPRRGGGIQHGDHIDSSKQQRLIETLDQELNDPNFRRRPNHDPDGFDRQVPNMSAQNSIESQIPMDVEGESGFGAPNKKGSTGEDGLGEEKVMTLPGLISRIATKRNFFTFTKRFAVSFRASHQPNWKFVYNGFLHPDSSGFGGSANSWTSPQFPINNTSTSQGSIPTPVFVFSPVMYNIPLRAGCLYMDPNEQQLVKNHGARYRYIGSKMNITNITTHSSQLQGTGTADYSQSVNGIPILCYQQSSKSSLPWYAAIGTGCQNNTSGQSNGLPITQHDLFWSLTTPTTFTFEEWPCVFATQPIITTSQTEAASVITKIPDFLKLSSVHMNGQGLPGASLKCPPDEWRAKQGMYNPTGAYTWGGGESPQPTNWRMPRGAQNTGTGADQTNATWNGNTATCPTRNPGQATSVDPGLVSNGYFAQTFFDHLTFSQDANVGKHTTSFTASNLQLINAYGTGPKLDGSVTQTNRSHAKDCYNLIVVVPRKAGEDLNNDPGILVCAIIETQLVAEVDYDMDDIANLNFTQLDGTFPTASTLQTDAQLTVNLDQTKTTHLQDGFIDHQKAKASGNYFPSMLSRKIPYYNNPWEATAHVSAMPYGDCGEGDNIQPDTYTWRLQHPQGWTKPLTKKLGKHAFVGVEEEDSNDSIDCELLG